MPYTMLFGLLKKYWYVIPVIGLIGYHYFTVSSLNAELSQSKKDYADLTANYNKALSANKSNMLVIDKLHNDLKTISETKDIIIEKKDKTIQTLNKILTDTKPTHYEHTYTYDKCTFKVKGDNNESSELYRTLDSIGF